MTDVPCKQGAALDDTVSIVFVKMKSGNLGVPLHHEPDNGHCRGEVDLTR